MKRNTDGQISHFGSADLDSGIHPDTVQWYCDRWTSLSRLYSGMAVKDILRPRAKARLVKVNAPLEMFSTLTHCLV